MTTTTLHSPATADSDELAGLSRRLHRISGQVLGVDKMLADHRSCEDVLIQLAAVHGALHAVGLEVLGHHIRTAVGAAADGARSPGDVATHIVALASMLTPRLATTSQVASPRR